MNSTEKKLVSVFTLLGSLASYYYGKANSKDSIPYIMVGGFIGAWVGEMLSKAWDESRKNKNDGNND